MQVEGSTLFGIYALAEASITASDLRISGTRVPPGVVGAGLVVTGSSEVHRAVVEDSTGYGVFVPRVSVCDGDGMCAVDEEATVLLTDLSVDGVDSVATDAGDVGRGLGVLGGRVEVTRARLRGVHETAIQVRNPAAALVLKDAVIEQVESSILERLRGHGIIVVEGAAADLERVRLRGAREVGILVEGEGSRLESRLVEVLETRPSDCGGPDCAGGVGLSVRSGAAARITEFLVDDNSLVGVQLLAGGQLDLESGQVSRSPIGANVQDVTFDITRLTRNVVFRDNATNLDSLGLPVPMAGPEGAISF